MYHVRDTFLDIYAYVGLLRTRKHRSNAYEVWHGVNAIRYRLWWAFPSIILASGGEVAGWVGRTISSYDVTSRTGFSIQ